ncbi:MAG: hypothetical protein GVY36_14705 [Verrucomicrobia bacterium]|jgi:xanthine dehydrogenase accessory factor|nr:hypothetical protein [Verrucomicrobiota bacterium]
MRLSEFWKRVRVELEAGRSVFACIVVDQQKGSPGTKAARLLLTEAGRQYGTIGGGIMEKELLDSAAELLASGATPPPEIRVAAHRPTEDELASGLICGGSQTNLMLVFHPDRHLDRIREIATAVASESHEVVRVTNTGLEKAGVVGPWADDPVKLLQDGRENWEVVIYLRNQRRMAVFGGGHCGAALARLMNDLGYAVSLIEPRKDVLRNFRMPRTVRRINKSFESGAGRVFCPGETHAVVMTYSMLTDVEALDGALTNDFKSIGVMGSRPKIAQIRSRLLEKGFSRLQVDAIRAPIGLSFNSDTPVEIAVSVAAEVLSDREKNTNG